MISGGEPFIRLSRAEVVQIVVGELPENQQAQFLKFSKLLSAWYHHQFHANLEQLKSDYQSIQTRPASTGLTHQVGPQSTDNGGTPRQFATELDAVARAANFTQISKRDLDQALAEESVFKLGLHVDFADFSEIVFYGRGASEDTAMISTWFGLRKVEIVFTNYEQVLVYIRFQSPEYFADRKELSFEPGSIVLKLFRNIPKADLEMLFPNTVIRMRLTDKLVIGIPAVFSGLIVLSTKVGTSLLLLGGIAGFWLGLSSDPVTIDQAGLVALGTGAGALGAYLWKQFNKFKNRKIRFMKALTEKLYFKNMDNDAGVLVNIIDYAEEAECKEVLFAYGELIKHGAMDEMTLAGSVQRHLPPGTMFDIHDAVTKLNDLALIELIDDMITPIPLASAIASLDARWDELFSSS